MTTMYDKLLDVSDDRIVSVSLGSATLLTPRNNILPLKSNNKIETANPVQGSLGWIKHGEQNTAVYSLSGDFDLRMSAYGDRTQCFILRHDNKYIGIACEDIQVLEYTTIKFQPLPECMKTDHSPIDSLCIYKNNDNNSHFGMIFTAASLFGYVSKLPEAHPDNHFSHKRVHHG